MENAILEQVHHIKYYAHYKHLPIDAASVEWVNKFAKLFREQYEHRQGGKNEKE